MENSDRLQDLTGIGFMYLSPGIKKKKLLGRLKITEGFREEEA